MISEGEESRLSVLMYEWGMNEADKVVRALEIERNLHGVCYGVNGYELQKCYKSYVSQCLL